MRNWLERRHIRLVLVSMGSLLWAFYLRPRHKAEGLAEIESVDPKQRWRSYELAERKAILWLGLALIQLGTYLQW